MVKQGYFGLLTMLSGGRFWNMKIRDSGREVYTANLSQLTLIQQLLSNSTKEPLET